MKAKLWNYSCTSINPIKQGFCRDNDILESLFLNICNNLVKIPIVVWLRLNNNNAENRKCQLIYTVHTINTNYIIICNAIQSRQLLILAVTLNQTIVS